MMRRLPSWRTYRVAFFVAVVLAMLGVGFVFQHKWKAVSQSGPAVYTIHQYITYQYNELKNPTGLLGLTYRNGQFWLYIADSGNHVIRAHNVNAGLWTVAGSKGNAGYVNADPWSSRFNYPTGLTGRNRWWQECDPDCPYRSCCWYNDYQYIYVNDSQNFVVRKLTLGSPPVGQYEHVETACGSGVRGMANGPSLSAQMGSMGGIKEIGTGYYLMADAENGSLRQWDGVNVSTYIGTGVPGFADGYATSAQFDAPTQMTSDASGNMYVADSGNNAIRKVYPSGYVHTVAGYGPEEAALVDGQGTNARFSRPTSVLFNPADGFTYIADSHNNVIRRMDSAGNVTTYAGTGEPGLVNGPRLSAKFSTPTDIVIHNGFMFVSDSMNNVIRAINMSNGDVITYIS
jgi:hypothetical protein